MITSCVSLSPTLQRKTSWSVIGSAYRCLGTSPSVCSARRKGIILLPFIFVSPRRRRVPVPTLIPTAMETPIEILMKTLMAIRRTHPTTAAYFILANKHPYRQPSAVKTLYLYRIHPYRQSLAVRIKKLQWLHPKHHQTVLTALAKMRRMLLLPQGPHLGWANMSLCWADFDAQILAQRLSKEKQHHGVLCTLVIHDRSGSVIGKSGVRRRVSRKDQMYNIEILH
jgi:hypothetical protein